RRSRAPRLMARRQLSCSHRRSSIMTFQADLPDVAELDRSEQSLQDFSGPRSPRAWFRQAIRNPALSAEAGSDFIRARMPTPQAPPAGERRIIDLPPLHEDDHPGREKGSDHRRRFPGRRTLALALAVPLFAVATAGGHLYWDYSRHFQST